jgi:t-SNARE complex subunit (syntaxin)
MERPIASVNDWVARQQDGQRLSARRDRRQAIRQWATVAVALCVIMAVMVAFGGG